MGSTHASRRRLGAHHNRKHLGVELLEPRLVLDGGSWEKLNPLGSLIFQRHESGSFASHGAILSEGFETGSLGPQWTTFSSHPQGRIMVSNSLGGPAHGGTFHLIMDVNSSGNGALNLNEAVLSVNLAGLNNVDLAFWHKDVNDEEFPVLPANFVDHANGDGVSISADGVHWRTVLDFATAPDPSGVYRQHTINLSAAAATAGISLGANFKIKFQQYDDLPLTTDGRTFDDIVVSADLPPVAVTEVPLEGGQKLTVVAKPDNPASILTVRVRSSTNALLAQQTATVPGQTVDLQTVNIPSDDSYKVEVTGNIGSSYQMTLYRNATVEVRDSANGSEQNATGSFIPLASGRFGILGSFGGGGVPVGGTVTELITNGNFESGNLTGWTVVNTGTGSWQINNGTFDPTGPGTPLAPISGNFDVVTSQGSPSSQILSELITVPSGTTTASSGITAATLRWSDRIRNFAPSFNDPTQEWRVKVLNASGGLIQEIFSTNPGDTLQQVGANQRSFDVTSLLQSLGGQQIRLSFEVQDELSYFNATLDDVSLLVQTGTGSPAPDVDEYLLDLTGRIGKPIDIALSAPASSAVPNTELVTNGSFETGDFTGWTLANTGVGGWQINNGTFDPPGPGTPLAPISGNFDAMSYRIIPGTHILSEPITVPAGITVATFSWSDRIRNFGASFSDPNQEWRVKILNSSGGLIQEIYSTNPGDPLQQVGPNQRSFNVTSLLQSLAGQSIRLSFEQQDNLGFFNATLDNVSLKISTAASPAAATLELLAPNGTTVLATGVAGASNFERGILNFVVPANGIYTLRVSSAGAGQYGIVVTDRLVFDTEPNSPNSLRSLNTVDGALGYLQPGDADTYTITVAAGQTLLVRTRTPFDKAVGSATPPATASTVELITNGNFESGNMTGWTVVNTGTGSWQINSGALDPIGPATPLPPISGNFDVVTTQSSPSTQILSELITVPSGISAATLRWTDRIQNFAQAFTDPTQEWRVKVLNASGGLIQEIFSTNPGDALQQVGPNARSFNVTSLLQSLAGQSIRLSFEVQDEIYYFNATLDDVSLLVQTGGGGGGVSGNLLDPALEVRDVNGNLVATDNDGGGDDKNARVKFTSFTGGTYRVTVSSEAGSGAGEYLLLASRFINLPPVIGNGNLHLNSNAILENGFVTITGSFTDPNPEDTHSVSINWSDGQTAAATVDQVHRTFTATHRYLDDGPSGSSQFFYPIFVTVSDGLLSGLAVAPVRVVNVDPVITALASDAPLTDKAQPGEMVTVNAAFTDVGTLDTHTAVIDWGDGTPAQPAALTQGSGSGTVMAGHAYANGGVFTVTLTLTDDDTGSAVQTTAAVVVGVGINNGVLQIVGTDGDDHVQVNKQGNGLFKVHADFFPTENFRTFSTAGVNRIEIYLGAGDDQATIAGNIDTPVAMHGEAGDDNLQGATNGPAKLWGDAGSDTLRGGNRNDVLDGGADNDQLWAYGGADILLGGAGDDLLRGGDGFDLLIGGLGADDLNGEGGDDLMIGASTIYDSNLPALDAILAQWNSPSMYENRISDLRTGSGPVLAGISLQAGVTVIDDGRKDRISGSAGRAWYFANLDGQGGDDDELLDRAANELVDLL